MNARWATRWKLAAILVAIMLASCGRQPGLTVMVSGVTVSMVRASVTESTRCSTFHGDAFPQTVPLTTVRTPTPVVLQFEAGQGASEVRGVIYDVDAPTPSGGPTEEFRLPGRGGQYQSRTIVPARTYRVLVNVPWSFLFSGGEETHVFQIRVEPP
jgi:hypothetical protein